MSRLIAVRTLAQSALVAGALLLFAHAPLAAHGEGVIRLASPQVALGGELVLTGEKLDTNATFRLELRGILDNYPVGQAKTNGAGSFQIRLALPAHVPEGVYTLVAIAPDGDVAARTTVTIGPTAGAAAATATMPGMPGMAAHGTQEMSGEHASAEMMELERSNSGAEWAVIVLFIVVTLGGGLALLRRSTAAGHG